MSTAVASPVKPALFRLMAISVGAVVANLYYAQPLLPDLAREFNLGVTSTGIVAMLGMTGAGIGQLIFVPLGDIRERRRLIVTMIACAAIALALMTTAQNAAWVMIATFACGVSASVNHITTPYAAHLAPEGERGRVVGTVIGGLLIGVLLSRTYVGWVGEVFGWRTVFASATLADDHNGDPDVALAAGRPAYVATHVATTVIASIGPLWREHAVLREAVSINSLMFCTFSGFWTAMVFFVESPPYNYTSRGAGLFRIDWRSRSHVRTHRRTTDGSIRRTQKRTLRNYRHAGLVRYLGHAGDASRGIRARRRSARYGPTVRPRLKPNTNLRIGSRSPQPLEYDLHDLLIHRRCARLLLLYLLLAPLRLVGRLRFFDYPDASRARPVVAI